MLCLYRRVLYLGGMSAIGRTTPVVQRQTYLELVTSSSSDIIATYTLVYVPYSGIVVQ